MATRRTALLSVFDKTGLEYFARSLVELNFDLLGSEGTVKYLKQHGIDARDVAEIVGEPILGHRVVTLSREIHAALLATHNDADQAELDRLGIPRIDLVYATFYPLLEEVEREGSTLESVIEKTDIGGPTMLRSGAKGRRIVLHHPNDLDVALRYLRGEYDHIPDIHRRLISQLAASAEDAVSEYARTSCTYHARFANGVHESFPESQEFLPMLRALADVVEVGEGKT